MRYDVALTLSDSSVANVAVTASSALDAACIASADMQGVKLATVATLGVDGSPMRLEWFPGFALVAPAKPVQEQPSVVTRAIGWLAAVSLPL